MTDQNRPATMDDVREAFTTVTMVCGGLSMFQGMAIVGALAEARVLDPMAVAKWAEFFATAPGPAAMNDEIRSGLIGFANVVKSMATKPAGSGEMRQ